MPCSINKWAWDALQYDELGMGGLIFELGMGSLLLNWAWKAHAVLSNLAWEAYCNTM